jgi:hypothetical protein
MKTQFTIGRTASGNIFVADYDQLPHLKACLITTGEDAGKWIERDAQFPDWLHGRTVKAESARAAADMLTAIEAEEKSRYLAEGKEICRHFGSVSGALAVLKNERTAMAELKASPSKLRAALKKAEKKAAKAKAERAMSAKITKIMAKLPLIPSKPMKGFPLNRVEIGTIADSTTRMIWNAVPPSHKMEWHGKWLMRAISLDAAKKLQSAKLI